MSRGLLIKVCFNVFTLKQEKSHTLTELKNEFEKLSGQMSPDVFGYSLLVLDYLELLAFDKIKATSRNSNMAPSQDLFKIKKPKGNGKKKVGGQVGHKGTTLLMTDSPDVILKHPAENCERCGIDLCHVLVEKTSKHQVVDIRLKKVITEHQVDHKTCDCGHHQCHGSAGAPIQYGASIKATAVELNQIQCVPYKRCAEFFQQKFDLSISPATLVAFTKEASARLLVWEQIAKAELLSALLIHADESGVNIDGKNWWVHILSSEKVTLMIPHLKRGREAMVEADVLEFFHGILSHDFWSSYGGFDVLHAICHAHLQREFEKIYKDYGQKWADKLAKLMLRANKERDEAEGCLSIAQMKYFEKEYSRLVKVGLKNNPENKKRININGKIGQSYPRQVLNRLVEYRDWVLLFLYDPNVPFTNNQAEREIRMLKVQQKVSGYFKTLQGAQDYCRIRSYVLTMGKNGFSKHEALTMLFKGT